MEYEVVHVPDQQQKSEPSTLKEVARHVGRTGARAAESVLGLPGDIASAALGIGNTLSGGSIPKYSDVQEALPISLPTSSQVRKGTQALTGEALEPQSEGEELYDEVIGDLASFLIPIKGKIPFKSAITKALGGNAASWFTKQVGGGEGAQVGAKLGFNLLSGLSGGRKVLTKEMNTSLDKAKDFARGERQVAKGLKEETNKIIDYVESGVKTPVKKFLDGPATSIGGRIRNNGLPIDEAIEIDKDLKGLIRDTATPKEALPYLEKMQKGVSKVLNDYGKNNKEFSENFLKYQDIDHGLNQSSRVSKFLQDNVNLEGTLKNPLTKGLFFGGLHYLNAIPTAVAGAGLAYGVREGSKALDFIKNSAEARKYYADAISASLKGNAAAATRNLSKLDKVADKYAGSHPEVTSDESSEYEVIKI